MAERQYVTDQYLKQDTIGAISTQVGGALTLFRVSGQKALNLIKQIIPQETVLKLKPRASIRTTVHHPETKKNIDDCLLVYFKAPESYTGEDVFEFSLHGGSLVATEFLEALHQAGIRQALPGEFSFRAVRNGKLNLSQAQAVSEIISAKNQKGLEFALEKLNGFESRWVQEVAEKLKKLAVYGELGIDFNDQDIDEVSLKNLKVSTLEIIEQLKNLEATYTRGKRIQNGIKAAIVGLPNAGKSSLFNALLGEDRAIVSNVPGTTRDIIREELLLNTQHGKFTLCFEDTAGIRKAIDPIEEEGISRTLSAAKNADLILFVLDATEKLTHEKTQEVQLILEEIKDKKTIGILSKCDLLGQRKIWPTTLELKNIKIVQWAETASTEGVGLIEVIELIGEQSESLTERKPGELILTRLENLKAVQSTILDLERASLSSEIDLFASDVRQALYHLSPIIGATLSDDILGSIFSGFCIGK